MRSEQNRESEEAVTNSPVVTVLWQVRSAVVAAVTVTAIVASSFVLSGCSKPPEPGNPDKPKSGDKDRDVSDRLVAMKWSRASADAVADVNQVYFEQLRQEDESAFEQQIALLGRVGNRHDVQEFLTSHPDTAGLFASALEVSPQACTQLRRVLVRYQEKPLVRSLFSLAAAPEDLSRVAQALDRDGDLIISLLEKGAWNSIPWFLISLDHPAAETKWRQWRSDVLGQALSSDRPEALARAQALLTIHAPSVQELLVESDSFRATFTDRYWPEFSRILNQQSDDVAWGIYVGEPRVWQIFEALDTVGIRLFESHGPLSVDLLMEQAYLRIRPEIVSALKHSNERVIGALFNCHLRDHPLFVPLVKRGLPGGSLAAALSRLQEEPKRIPELLKYYATLTDAALIEELGPPPSGPRTWLPGYSLYYLSRKWGSGRRISGLEVALAVAETALDVVPVMKGSSKGLKLVQSAVADGLAKRGVKLAGKAARNGSPQTLFPWILKKHFAVARKSLSGLSPSRVDVTPYIRGSFKYSGVGRKTFRRFTGLEPRIFMRGDRRVVVNLVEVSGEHHAVGRAARHVMNAAAQELLPPLTSNEIARRSANAAVDAATSTRSGRQKRRPALLDHAWKRHLAAWWLASALGELWG